MDVNYVPTMKPLDTHTIETMLAAQGIPLALATAQSGLGTGQFPA